MSITNPLIFNKKIYNESNWYDKYLTVSSLGEEDRKSVV